MLLQLLYGSDLSLEIDRKALGGEGGVSTKKQRLLSLVDTLPPEFGSYFLWTDARRPSDAVDYRPARRLFRDLLARLKIEFDTPCDWYCLKYTHIAKADHLREHHEFPGLIAWFTGITTSAEERDKQLSKLDQWLQQLKIITLFICGDVSEVSSEYILQLHQRILYTCFDVLVAMQYPSTTPMAAQYPRLQMIPAQIQEFAIDKMDYVAQLYGLNGGAVEHIRCTNHWFLGLCLETAPMFDKIWKDMIRASAARYGPD